MTPSRVVFFLGAGASVPAGVPDTFSFVEEFEKAAPIYQMEEATAHVLKRLRAWKGAPVDIELLLETLTRLQNSESDALLGFLGHDARAMASLKNLDPLIRAVKDFIKSRGLVSIANTEHFRPILGFLSDYHPLDVITVNYDVCIEQFCYLHRLTCRDGFQVYWDSAEFEKPDTDIRLYKLHGSVTWYQSDFGAYVKLPVKTESSQVELISGEHATNLMLYPMQKWGYAEPLLELLVAVKRILESDDCHVVVVVGYSFRDEHIRTMFWDTARKNRQLHVVLVDPNANDIYEDRLEYYTSDSPLKVATPLRRRVVCLPYKFQEAFRHLRSPLLTDLTAGIVAEQSARAAENEGKPPNWTAAIRHFAHAEHSDVAEALIHLASTQEQTEPALLSPSLDLNLRLAWNLWLRGKIEQAAAHLADFETTLRRIMVETIHAEVSVSPAVAILEFGYTQRKNGGASSTGNSEMVRRLLLPLLELCATRKRMAAKSVPELWRVAGILENLDSYLSLYEKGIPYENYHISRKQFLDDAEVVKTMRPDKDYREWNPETSKKLERIIVETEARVLSDILAGKPVVLNATP